MRSKNIKGSILQDELERVCPWVKTKTALEMTDKEYNMAIKVRDGLVMTSALLDDLKELEKQER